MQMSISLNNSTVLVLVNGKKFELTRTRTRRFWTLISPQFLHVPLEKVDDLWAVLRLGSTVGHHSNKWASCYFLYYCYIRYVIICLCPTSTLVDVNKINIITLCTIVYGCVYVFVYIFYLTKNLIFVPIKTITLNNSIWFTKMLTVLL